MSDLKKAQRLCSGVLDGGRAWLVCLSAGLFCLYEFFQLNVFDVINPALRVDFNINMMQLGWLSSAYLWANIIFLIPAGILLDRQSTRRVILVTLLMCIIGTLGFSLVTSFRWAFFFHALAGVGNAFSFLACIILISRWFSTHQQAFAIGWIATLSFIGGMLAHTPVVFLNALFGWRVALYIDVFCGVLIWIWLFVILRDSPKALEKEPVFRPKEPLQFMKVLWSRQTLLPAFYTASLNLPIMIFCALWGASYLTEVHHLTAIAASRVMSLLFVGSIVGCPVAGFISDKMMRRKPVMIGGALATLLCFIPLFFDVVLSEVSLSIIFSFIGFFTGTQVVSYPMITESHPKKRAGLALAVASIVIMGGAGFGQVIFGTLIHQTTETTQASYQMAMGIFPLSVGLALVAVFFAHETFCKSGISRRDDGDSRYHAANK